MGFISFSLDYYKTELQKLESAIASEETVYHAKQLLKMLDDLFDEGYTELNEKLEEEYHGVSRLRKYLKENNAIPFSVHARSVTEADVKYELNDTELIKAIKELMKSAENSTDVCKDDFLLELIHFCEWIGYKEDTAYVFLLRDTLLPYIYYQSNDRGNIYPWLLGRKTLTMLLKSIDNRVDVRMYTTYPYLLGVYGDKIYSPKYEENRLFETMYSQDLYFQVSESKDGHFYVRKCKNEEVGKCAFAEVKAVIK